MDKLCWKQKRWLARKGLCNVHIHWFFYQKQCTFPDLKAWISYQNDIYHGRFSGSSHFRGTTTKLTWSDSPVFLHSSFLRTILRIKADDFSYLERKACPVFSKNLKTDPLTSKFGSILSTNYGENICIEMKLKCYFDANFSHFRFLKSTFLCGICFQAAYFIDLSIVVVTFENAYIV